MKKRLLTVLLAVCLVLALGTVTAAAADGDDYAEWTSTTSLPTSGTYKLMNDVTVDDETTIGSWASSTPETPAKTLILDLNGKTITTTDGQVFYVQTNGGLTISDSVGTGKITNNGVTSSSKNVVYVSGHFEISGGTIENTTRSGYALYVNSSGKATISGGTIVNTGSSGYSLQVNSNASVELVDGTITNSIDGGHTVYVNGNNGSFSMSGGTINQNSSYSSSAAIEANNTAHSVKISGGIVNSASMGVYAAFTPVTVTGGNFETTSYAFETRKLSINPISDEDVSVKSDRGLLYSFSGSSNEISGGKFDVPYVVTPYTSEDESTLEISGGIFSNLTAVQSRDTNTTIEITKGTFKNSSGTGCTDVNDYIPDSISMEVDPNTGEIIVAETAVVTVNGVGYDTLQAAVDAVDQVKEQSTITLLNDVTGSGVKVKSGNNIIFDLNGYTYTINSGVGSSGTETNGFQLLKDSNITIKNGKITSDSEDVLILIQNYSDLSLEDVELDGRNLANGAGTEYTLSNNNGEINLYDGTVIYAKSENDVAMDVCWAKSYQDGAHVRIHEGAVINGTVELGLWNQTAYEDDQSALVVDGGIINGELTIMTSGSQYGDTNEAIQAVKSNVDIISGTFAGNVDAYIDSANEANARVTGNGQYAYFQTVSEAESYAANIHDAVVTDISVRPVEGETWTVTVNYNNGTSSTAKIVANGDKFDLPTAPTRSGYTFGGWRCGNNVYKAGETVTVNSDMVFTAVWSAINIPDTYDIEIADTANGSVDTSLSNASAGSTITITATPDSGYSVASVTVTGPDGRVDVVRVNATTYTFKMPAGDVTVRVTFTDSDALPFTDVSAGQWFYDAVAYVYTNGMMEGDSATTFNPDGTMTRAMFWAVLGRIDGATITGTNWADQARDWAMAEGVSDGTDPNGLVTREQMVTMLWRYAVAKGYDVSIGESTNILSYADFGQISEYAIPAMQWGCGSGVITGVTESTLEPAGTATRAQCAAIFMRFVVASCISFAPG